MMLFLIFVAGLLIGSFLNVCIYRLPRRKSIVFPASHCPQCEAPVRPWDNIPILSFIALRGKCRTCGATIHWRYPVVELLGGALFLSCYLAFGVSAELFVYYAFVCAMVVVAFVDLEFQIIPDEISLPFIVIGFAASFFIDLGWRSSLLGIVAGGGTLVAFALVYLHVTKTEGVGAGDFKLAAMIGAFLGWKGVLMVIFLASLAGALVGVALMVIFRLNRKTAIPFGSLLAPIAIFVLFFGSLLLETYARLSASSG
jgi:leader peptidase (prepilin peptidase)/N-methyltransferase